MLLLYIKKTEIGFCSCISEKSKNFQFQLSYSEKLRTENSDFEIWLGERRMINSKSAFGAEADSDGDSKLSLTLFREGSDRTIIYWSNLY